MVGPPITEGYIRVTISVEFPNTDRRKERTFKWVLGAFQLFPNCVLSDTEHSDGIQAMSARGRCHKE